VGAFLDRLDNLLALGGGMTGGGDRAGLLAAASRSIAVTFQPGKLDTSFGT
jgi:hypothetical protein